MRGRQELGLIERLHNLPLYRTLRHRLLHVLVRLENGVENLLHVHVSIRVQHLGKLTLDLSRSAVRAAVDLLSQETDVLIVELRAWRGLDSVKLLLRNCSVGHNAAWNILSAVYGAHKQIVLLSAKRIDLVDVPCGYNTIFQHTCFFAFSLRLYGHQT